MREIMKLGPILIALCFSNLTLGQLIRTNTPATGISYIGNALMSTDNIIYVCWVEDSLNNPSPSPNDDGFKIIGLILIGFTITIIRLIFLNFDLWADFRGYPN